MHPEMELALHTCKNSQKIISENLRFFLLLASLISPTWVLLIPGMLHMADWVKPVTGVLFKSSAICTTSAVQPSITSTQAP